MISPPKVTGVFYASNKDGISSSLVLIKGKYWRENEHIKGFTIVSISPEGVVFGKSGKTWFVPAPKGLYSLTHADGS